MTKLEISNKKIIVTGGISGIGLAIVESMLKQDAVVAVLDRDIDKLKAFQRERANVLSLECNLCDPVQVEQAVETVFGEFGEIDALVNNAGIIHNEPLVTLGPSGIVRHNVANWQQVIATDLSSVFYLTANVVEKMILKRRKGVIVNISSVCASGNAGQSAYSAAKAGVNALTATWAKELGPLGIRVLAVAPGYTETASTKDAMKDDVLKGIVRNVPLRRLGKPSEIAAAVIALMTNDFCTGKVFEVDGGLVL